MKIGVLGTGDVGQVLGRGLVEAGHQVKMGSRNPQQEKVRAWLERVGINGSAGTLAEAASFGEAAVLATGWSGTEEAIRLAGPGNLAGKLVMDATNPLEFSQCGPRHRFRRRTGATLAEGLPGGESVQHRGQSAYGSPAVPGRPAGHVHLRQ